MLNSSVRRNLCDRSSEKRRIGALELLHRVRSALPTKDVHMRSVVDSLLCDLLASGLTNLKKGGLTALAAIVVALQKESDTISDRIIPTVLSMLNDPNPHIRVSACESLYNIIKVARVQSLPFFPPLLDVLCSLIDSSDVVERSGVEKLNTLLKDIVSDSPYSLTLPLLPVIERHLHSRSAYTRQLLLCWIILLHQQLRPALDSYSRMLPAVFELLDDEHKDIRFSAHNTLLHMWRAFLQRDSSSTPSTLYLLLETVSNTNCSTVSRYTALLRDRFSYAHFPRSRTALHWLAKTLRAKSIDDHELPSLLPFMTKVYISCLSHADLHADALKVHQELVERLLVGVSGSIAISSPRLTTQLEEAVRSSGSTRFAALQWLCALLCRERDAASVLARMASLSRTLFEALEEASLKCTTLVVEALARAALALGNLRTVLCALFEYFRTHQSLLHHKGRVIISLFCEHLDGESVFVCIANLLTDERDQDLSSRFVRILQTTLLLSPSLFELRERLNTDYDSAVFVPLFNAWCCDPVSCLALCLYAHAYELSAAVVLEFVHLHPSLDLLEQIVQLIDMFESPAYIRVRLHLSRPHSYPYLLKSLYGVLATIPQTDSFLRLHTRLQAIDQVFLQDRYRIRQNSESLESKVRRHAACSPTLLDKLVLQCRQRWRRKI